MLVLLIGLNIPGIFSASCTRETAFVTSCTKAFLTAVYNKRKTIASKRGSKSFSFRVDRLFRRDAKPSYRTTHTHTHTHTNLNKKEMT